MTTFLLFMLGLAMLLVGGRGLVAAAVEIATRLRVPPLLVGLTLVAWGTSAPELAFNLTAAIQGKTDLIFGNTVGASICNLGLVMGLSAMITPLAVDSKVVRREVPLMLLLFALFSLVAAWPALDTLGGGRVRPGLILAVFAAYSAYMIREGMMQRAENETLAEQVSQSEIVTRRRSVPMIVCMLLGGLALLGVGGSLAAEAASSIAKMLGMSDRVVGLTVVALGTTLPELVTSILAVRSKQTDLAVGNAVGSCIFNIGAIAAVCGLVSPSGLPEGGWASLVTLLVLGVLLIPMSRTFQGRIARIEGGVLLAVQGAYIAFELMRTKSGG